MKSDLHHYLRTARESLLWKIDGLTEYNVRRPLTPTGTNMLGLVKHLASMEILYFGEVFGRPVGQSLPWLADDAEPNADMWARVNESRENIVGLYHRAVIHADATIGELTLDTEAHVPWWPEGRRDATLHRVMVHMVAETHRHGGHADIVRELIDGRSGVRKDRADMASDGRHDQDWWKEYHDQIEQAARDAGGTAR
jgi:hypothetical protein